jgi:glutamyl-tRNA reductase
VKYNPDETMEEWSKRVILFEVGNALTRMANKENIEEILSDVSHNITNKLSHPILYTIRESAKQDVEEELRESRIRYQKNYLDKFTTKPDHTYPIE